MKNRVVITGMGAVTPIGNTEAEFWENAKSGKLGIDTIKSIDTQGLDVKFAGEVKNLDIEKFLDKKECRRLDKFTQYALIASMEADENAKLKITTAGGAKAYGIYINNENYEVEINPRLEINVEDAEADGLASSFIKKSYGIYAKVSDADKARIFNGDVLINITSL